MGNSPPVFDPAAEKQKLEINCYKIKGYLELNRERKLNDAKNKEKLLIKAITSPNRARQDEIEKARIIITGLNYVKACDILIRYSEIIKDKSMIIIENRKDHQKIVDLIPFLETIIWSVKYMGIDILLEFQEYIIYLFGTEFKEAIEKSLRIDPDLKACFENLVPTPIEVNNYMVDLSEKNSLPLEKINEVGHEFARQGGPPTGPFSGPFNGPCNGPCNGPFNGPGNGAFNNNANFPHIEPLNNNNCTLNNNNNGFNGVPNQFNAPHEVNNNLNNNTNNTMAFGNYAPPNPNINNGTKPDNLPNLDDFEERLKKLKG